MRKLSESFNKHPSQATLNKCLFEAAREGSGDLVSALLEQGANPDAKIGKLMAQTALHIAVAHGHAEIAKTLIRHGADIEAKMGGGMDWTPLHVAAMTWGGKNAALVLLDHGADVNARDGFGFTLLEWANKQSKSGTAQAIREAFSLRHAKRTNALRLVRKQRVPAP